MHKTSGVGRIFRGERPGHLTSTTRPAQGSGGEGAPDGTEVSFFQTIHFQFFKNSNIFLAQKIHVFDEN